MQKKKCWGLFVVCLLLCAMLAGCSDAKDGKTDSGATGTPAGTPEGSSAATQELSAAQLDAYQQMTLYIQEGFRKYRVEGSYEAYFAAIEQTDGTYSCDILLEGEDGLWSEELAYTYDSEAGWYTFDSQWESVMTGDTFYAESEDSEFVTTVKETYVYKTRIAQKLDVAIPIHYYGESGPVETHEFMSSGNNGDQSDTYALPAWIYTYRDNRMHVNATIEYPKVIFTQTRPGLEEKINATLQDAFLCESPADELYTDIYTHYAIERADEKYLSLEIYEYYSYQFAAHPSSWSRTVTIDMETGEVLCLEDVVGEKWTLQTLLDSGAFSCTWLPMTILRR